MNPLTILALANAALQMSKGLIPVITQLRNEGQITAEQQAEVLANYEAVKSAAAFAGPEWQQSGR